MKKIIYVILAVLTVLALCTASSSCNTKKHDEYDFRASTDTGYDPSAKHGEKSLYGRAGVNKNFVFRKDDFYLEFYFKWLMYYSSEERENGNMLCFDPSCKHWDDNCSAYINIYVSEKEGEKIYPYFFFIDQYDNVESTVIYFAYRRSQWGVINDVEYEREPNYCIERFDISEGKRRVIAEDLKYTIDQFCSYGDDLYFVADTGDDDIGKMLFVLGKSGGMTSHILPEKTARSISLEDVQNDRLYFIVNDRYLCSCKLDLSDQRFEFDLTEIKGNDGSAGLYKGMYNGYLYYFCSIEGQRYYEDALTEGEHKGSLCRLSLSDLNVAPELIAENIYTDPIYCAFTDGTFYYEPFVYERLEPVPGTNLMPLNLSDGKLMAYDMDTGEHRLIAENLYINIDIRYAWKDMALITGWAYCKEGQVNSNSDNKLLVVYSDGREYGVWREYNKDSVGRPDANFFGNAGQP